MAHSKNKNQDEEDVRIISNLNYNQQAIGQEMSDEMEIQKGISQGCTLLLLLINAYSEELILTALESETAN